MDRDFHPDDDPEDGESLYEEKIKEFNALLRDTIKGNPDMFIVQLKGMFNVMKKCLRPEDGKHLPDGGNYRLYIILKNQSFHRQRKLCKKDYMAALGYNK